MDQLWRDIRYALRLMARAPLFSGVAVLVLALGIGANSAIFSAFKAVMLDPLPFREPESLMVLRSEFPEGTSDALSPANFLDYEARNTTFESMVASRLLTRNMTGTGEPLRVRAAMVTWRFLDVLGVRPMLGSPFNEEHSRRGNHRVALISFGAWQEQFGGAADVTERTLELDGESHRILGVMPPGFEYPSPVFLSGAGPSLWLPMAWTPEEAGERGANFLSVLGRLKTGVTPEQALSNLQSIRNELHAAFPDEVLQVALMPAIERAVGFVRSMMLVFVTAVALVLLIASLNVASLLVNRAIHRERELSVRTCMGAHRVTLLRQLMTESLVLALAGGLLGVILGSWMIDLFKAVAPQRIPRLQSMSMDGTTLLVAAGLSLITGLFFGTIPALRIMRGSLSESLKEGGRTGPSAGRARLRASLVVVQVALSLVLLVGSGLLIRSLAAVLGVNSGFNPENVMTVPVALPQGAYAEPSAKSALFERLVAEVRALPGVVSAAVVTQLPMAEAYALITFDIEGHPRQPGEPASIVEYHEVSNDYFRTMAIPLISGRDVQVTDHQDANPVALISKSAAEQYWPGQDPIGKRVRFDPEQPWITVVGVVGDVRQRGLDAEIRPNLYLPHTQAPTAAMTLVVRAAEDSGSIVGPIRDRVRYLDARLPIGDALWMAQRLSRSTAERRFNMIVLCLFAIMAAVLTAVGLYGVVSNVVSQRTQEIGIRVALGARQSEVLRLILGYGMTLSAVGIVLGLLAAAVGIRAISSLLFGVSPTDALTFASVCVLLLLISLAACYLPTRRALRVEPTQALKYE